MAVNLSELGC